MKLQGTIFSKREKNKTTKTNTREKKKKKLLKSIAKKVNY